jgi:hypothetical protein
MFEAERPSLVPYAGPFDGFHATPVSPSKNCLVRFNNNKYSVAASERVRSVSATPNAAPDQALLLASRRGSKLDADCGSGLRAD